MYTLVSLPYMVWFGLPQCFSRLSSEIFLPPNILGGKVTEEDDVVRRKSVGEMFGCFENLWFFGRCESWDI